MKWQCLFLPEAEEDLRKLDGSQRILVAKALKKVLQNPLPASEGGYGKPLGNHNKTALAGLYKIKIRSAGIRIVYRLIRVKGQMIVLVIGARADDEVYLLAAKRK